MSNRNIAQGIMWAAVLLCAVAAGQVAPASGNEDQAQSRQPEASPQSLPATAASADPHFGVRNPRYRLRPGDVIELSFAFQPEFNQSIPVQPDGFATLRQIGDLQVSGLTVPEFKAMVVSRYGVILNNNEIEVQLKDFEKPYFMADGQVGHPGKFELRGQTTVTQGLAMSGGMNSSAKHSQVLLFRRVNDQWFETKVLDVKRMVKDKNLAEDIELQPGDLIFVPRNRISKIERFVPSPGLGMALAP
jgi:polysaccharide export outer membrane protein